MSQKRLVRCILFSVLTVLVSLLLGIICVAQQKSRAPTEARDFRPISDSIYDYEGFGLSLPFRNPEDISELWCFGLKPWQPPGTEGPDEIHGGIDLVPKYKPEDVPAFSKYPIKYPIVASADAQVEKIVPGFSGDRVATVVVVLKMNDYWYIACSFEPQSVSDAINRAQLESIVVREGDTVRRGQLLGYLLVGSRSVKPGSYPHLHFGFFYKHPRDILEDIQANYLRIRRSDGTDLAPTSGPDSPWQPGDLEIETTFYCPYEYSTARTKAIYDRLRKRAPNGDYCACVCAYGSEGGNCGVCGTIPVPLPPRFSTPRK